MKNNDSTGKSEKNDGSDGNASNDGSPPKSLPVETPIAPSAARGCNPRIQRVIRRATGDCSGSAEHQRLRGLHCVAHRRRPDTERDPASSWAWPRRSSHHPGSRTSAILTNLVLGKDIRSGVATCARPAPYSPRQCSSPASTSLTPSVAMGTCERSSATLVPASKHKGHISKSIQAACETARLLPAAPILFS